MGKYDTVLFDLDGTLTDSAPGITACVQKALDHFGLHYEQKDLTVFVGPPLRKMFPRFGVSQADVEEAVTVFRQNYEDWGKYENAPYDGIKALLSDLSSAGIQLGVATSKPEKFSRRILDHFGMTPYLDCILGNSMHLQVEKSDMIKKIVDLYGISKEQAVMVGDRRFDVEAAHKAGVDCIGVSYGFAPEGELEKAGADHIVDTVPRLTEQLLSL